MKKTDESFKIKRKKLRSQIGSYRRNRVISLILLVLIGIWTLPNIYSNFKISQTQKEEIENLKISIKEMEKEYEKNQELLKEAGSLEFVEKRAREELGMIKAHEMVVVFTDSDEEKEEEFQEVETKDTESAEKE